MINETKLVQQIKKAAKGRLIWQVTEKGNYITDAHWMVKLETVPTKVKAALYESFGREAKAGESLLLAYKTVTENGPNCENLFNPTGCDVSGQLTPITILPIDQKDKSIFRLVKIGTEIAYINNEYAELIESNTAAAIGKNATGPIYFGDLLILPLRLPPERDQEIKSYLAG